MRGSRRKGILFRTKKGFRRDGAGRTGRSIKQGEQTTRKHWCWEEPALWEVQEVYRNEGHGVICSLFSRFPTFDKIILVPKLPKGFVFLGIDLHDLL